jgi:hypothetical protein
MANALPRDALAGGLAPAPAASTPGGDPQSAFCAALRGGAAPRVTARGRDAAHRIAIYRNGMVSGLADALAATYPVTRELVGGEMFRAAAVAHARAARPSSPVLHRWGDGFADLLATLPGLAPYRYVPEVARIEFARVAATHAADAPPLDPATLAAVDPEALRLAPHPAAQLVATPHGGLAAWRASVGEPPVEAAAALVTRPAMTLIVTPLPPSAARLCSRLFAGETLGEAAEDDLPTALAPLLAAGAFAALSGTT